MEMQEEFMSTMLYVGNSGINELDRHQYGGRSLTVNEAKPMTPRGAFGGGRQRRESRW
jgi:hypothetical protein